MKRSGSLARRTPLRSLSTLARGGSLKRSRMKPWRRKPRPGLDDKAYKAWIRKQPCCCGCGASAPSDPAHENGAGMALKAHDHTCIPMRRRCHRDYDTFSGKFKTWTREQRQAWHESQVARYRELYARRAA